MIARGGRGGGVIQGSEVSAGRNVTLHDKVRRNFSLYVPYRPPVEGAGGGEALKICQTPPCKLAEV
jgi:hypothetical protein